MHEVPMCMFYEDGGKCPTTGEPEKVAVLVPLVPVPIYDGITVVDPRTDFRGMKEEQVWRDGRRPVTLLYEGGAKFNTWLLPGCDRFEREIVQGKGDGVRHVVFESLGKRSKTDGRWLFQARWASVGAASVFGVPSAA